MAAAQGQQEYLQSAVELARNGRAGTLATAADGQPHAALVTFAYLPDGAPLLLLSNLSAHTRQLRRNPACCLLVTGAPNGDNPQTTPRLALSGRAAVTQDPAARAGFLAAHPYAAQYADFADFQYWRLDLSEVQFVGGFAAAFRLNVVAVQQGIIAAERNA